LYDNQAQPQHSNDNVTGGIMAWLKDELPVERYR
jgi:rhodanese-related sulfurtransferase